MWEAIIGAVAVIVVGVLSFHGGRTLSKSQSNAVDVDTLLKLSSEVQRLNDELIKVKNQVETFEDKNRVLWQYVCALIEQMHAEEIVPADPPVELESDPILMKLLKRKKQ